MMRNLVQNNYGWSLAANVDQHLITREWGKCRSNPTKSGEVTIDFILEKPLPLVVVR